jgi:hypothetical protein
MPYRLFALSSLASMLALLSYPVLVEPNPDGRGADHPIRGPQVNALSLLTTREITWREIAV